MAEWEPWLSPSQASMFLRCARQWAFRYKEGLKLRPAGVMKQSGVMHSAIERNYRQKIESRKDLPEDEILDFYEQMYDLEWQREEVELREGENKDFLKEQGLQMTREHHRGIAPKVQPVLVEHRFDLHFVVPDQNPKESEAKYGFRVKGVIDVVDDHHVIADNKGYSKTPTQDELDRDIQLSIYALERSITLKEIQPDVRMDLVLKTVKPTVKMMPSKRNREGLLMTLNTLGNIAKAINADAFPRNPTGWHCSKKWCGYWDRCMGLGQVTIDLGENLESQLKESVQRAEQSEAAQGQSAQSEPEEGRQEGGGSEEEGGQAPLFQGQGRDPE